MQAETTHTDSHLDDYSNLPYQQTQAHTEGTTTMTTEYRYWLAYFDGLITLDELLNATA